MGQNLGAIMQKAGVRHAHEIREKNTGKPRVMMNHNEFSIDMRKLYPEFAPLSSAINGNEFLQRFEIALSELNHNNPTVNALTVTRLLNLARHLRDTARSNGLKKSFDPVVRFLQEIEHRVKTCQVQGKILDYIEERLKEFGH